MATTRTETEPAIVFTADTDTELYVPTLAAILTSREGHDSNRQFTEHHVQRVTKGLDEFQIFESDVPASGDALYLCFEEDLSYHIVGVHFEVDTAEGAGINPNDPPYVWEVMGYDEETNWEPVEVDYDGTYGFNVTGLVRLHLPAIQRATRSGHTGYWVRCRIMSQEESDSPRYQVSPRIGQLYAESWGITVQTSNVSVVRNEVLGRSDGTPGQRFYLTHLPVVPRQPGEYLIVRHDDGTEERWTEVPDFADSGPDDRHYTIDSMSGELRLAPALPQRDGSIKRYGMLVPKKSMLMMRAYRYGGGFGGNVASDALNVLKSALPYVERVSNRRAARGGLDAEDLHDAKVRVPGYLRSLGRAVTTADYEYLTHEAAPGQVSRVYCLQPQNGVAGEVQVLVVPQIPQLQRFIAPESLALSVELREQIEGYLDERRLLSTRLRVMEPNYTWVQTDVKIRASMRYEAEGVRERVIDRLFQFLHPLTGGEEGRGWNFGRSLLATDILPVIMDVPGVEFVRSVRLYTVQNNNGRFSQGNEAEELIVPEDGIIASYEHRVELD